MGDEVKDAVNRAFAQQYREQIANQRRWIEKLEEENRRLRDEVSNFEATLGIISTGDGDAKRFATEVLSIIAAARQTPGDCGCATLRNGAVATCADHNWGMDRLEQPPGNARSSDDG